jgi:hypothetical protein
MQTLGHANANAAKVLWIKNTLSCQKLMASEAYLDETRARDDLVTFSEPQPLAFDPGGDLMSVF